MVSRTNCKYLFTGIRMRKHRKKSARKYGDLGRNENKMVLKRSIESFLVSLISVNV